MTSTQPFVRLLLVSEDDADEQAVNNSLKKTNISCLIRRVTTEVEMIDALDKDTFSLVLIDAYAKFTPLEVITILEAREQEIPYLVLYGSVEELTGVELLASTDHNFVTKSNIGSIGKAILAEMEDSNAKMKKRLELEQSIAMLLDGLGRMMELRDKGTDGHTQRVASLAVQFARVLKVPKAKLINVYRGSLMHDLGKIGIPDSILLKPGPLTDDEWVVMRTHPDIAYKLISPIPLLRDALEIPLCHHEKYDGSGYPVGLRDVNIPFSARLFSIVDSYDALTSSRPYRDAWTHDEAIEYILNERGRSFDPAIVSDFVTILK